MLMIPILFSVIFFWQKRMIYSLEWEFFLPIDTKNKLAMTCVVLQLIPWSSPEISFGNSFLFDQKRGARGEFVQSNAVVRWHDAVDNCNYHQALQKSMQRNQTDVSKRIVSVWNERRNTVHILLDLSGTSCWRAPWGQKKGTRYFPSMFSPTKILGGSRILNGPNGPWLRLLELSPTYPCICWDWSILVAVISKWSRSLTKQGAPKKFRGAQINYTPENKRLEGPKMMGLGSR